MGKKYFMRLGFVNLKLISRHRKSRGCYTNHKMIGFCLVDEFNQRGSATNGATLSIFLRYTAPAQPSYTSYDNLQGSVVHYCQPTNPASPLHHASHRTGHPQALTPLYQLGNRVSLQDPLMEYGIYIFRSDNNPWTFPINPLTSSELKDDNNEYFSTPLLRYFNHGEGLQSLW